MSGEELRGFSRGGFAPIPRRHDDLPPLPPPPARFEREREDFDRREPIREREFPRRELDPDPELERWERRLDRDDFERGRGHPPDDPYGGRQKRRRSPSPGGPSHRPRQYSPSSPRHGGPQHNLPDPASLDYLLNFRQFSEWFRVTHPKTAQEDLEEVHRQKEEFERGDIVSREKVGMAKRYERYRKEYFSRQLYALYLTHRGAPWFGERYSNDEESVALRQRIHRHGRTQTATEYARKLRAGDMDNVSYEQSDESEKPSLSRRYSEHDEPEGLDRALEEQPHDEAPRVEVPPKGHQIFVKTVPPSTSRKSLEDLFAKVKGFQYLAITEPQIKKSFHRVAWAQFDDRVDVKEVVQELDGSKIDNFTFHMGVNAAPVVGRVRVTAPVANTLERLLIDADNAKALALKFEDEALADAVKGGEDAEGNGDKGEDGLQERVSDVVQQTIERLVDREGLIGEELSEEQKLQKARITADHWISYLRNGLSTCYYCVAPMAYAEELQRKCISHVRPDPATATKEELDFVPEAKPEVEAESDVKPEAEESVKPEAEESIKQEVAESAVDGREGRDDPDSREADVEEKPKSLKDRLAPRKSGDEKWAEVLDMKLRPLLGEVDVKEYGGRDIEEATKRLAAPLIRQEEESKYRCKECSKLFKAPEFVVKHVTTKHPETVKPKLDEYAVFNNFVVDPQRLQPSAQTPAAIDDRLPQNAVGMSGPAFNPMMPLPNIMANMSGPMNGNGISNGGGGGGQGTQNGFGGNAMQQQMMMMLQMQQMMMAAQQGGFGMNGGGGAGGMGTGMGQGTGGGRGLGGRIGGFADDARQGGGTGIAVPIGGGSEDPRARRGRVSYRDLDEADTGGADGGLPY